MSCKEQNNRGRARAVVATNKKGKQQLFTSVRQCAKFLKRNPAAVTKVCQGAWNRCNGYKLRYKDED